MKIIKNNYEETFQFTCNKCGSVIEYNDDDICVDSYGYRYVICPCCGDEYDLDQRVITVDNVTYPEDYHDFSNGKNWNDESINEYVKKIILWLKDNPNEPFKYVASGNTFICVFNHYEDEEYYVVVTKNYLDTFVEKEKN